MFEVIGILLVLSLSLSLLGSLLVVNQKAMLTDALSHSVLLGIVLGFLITGHLDSPLLIVGAAVFGLVSVFLIEKVQSRRLAQDAATGLVVSAFFALGILLISLFARNSHLDLDMVFMGEVLFAPFDRMMVFGVSFPVALIKSLVLFLIVSGYFIYFLPALSVLSFDKTQANLQGIRTSSLSLFSLFLSSLASVLAFDLVGSITVIVFMTAPAMTALSWAKTFKALLMIAMLVGAITVVLGSFLAFSMDLSLAGTCGLVALGLFVCSLYMRSA